MRGERTSKTWEFFFYLECGKLFSCTWKTFLRAGGFEISFQPMKLRTGYVWGCAPRDHRDNSKNDLYNYKNKKIKKNSTMLTRQWPLRRYTLRLSQERNERDSWGCVSSSSAYFFFLSIYFSNDTGFVFCPAPNEVTLTASFWSKLMKHYQDSPLRTNWKYLRSFSISTSSILHT